MSENTHKEESQFHQAYAEAEPTIDNKPLLLYLPLYDFVAQEFVEKMNEIPSDQPIDIWMNCPGGSVFAGWSIIGPLQQRTGKKNLCVFGHAMSMAVYMALFCDNVEALEITQFMIHRADMYVENESDKTLLSNVNKDLRKQMESRLNMELFEDVCGCSMDDIFNAEKRMDVMLTAKQAKKLGLINSIKKLTPQEAKACTENFVAFADFSKRIEGNMQRSNQEANTNKNNNQFKKTMTAQELKTQHPESYAEIFAAGEKAGVKAEQTRVNSWLPFMDYDKDNVVKAIKEGTEFTAAVNSEMIVKITAGVKKEEIKLDSAGKIVTGKTDDKTETQKEVEAFQAEVKKGINVKTKVL